MENKKILTPEEAIAAYKKCANAELAVDCVGCLYKGKEDCHKELSNDVVAVIEDQQRKIDMLKREHTILDAVVLLMSNEIECNFCRFRKTCSNFNIEGVNNEKCAGVWYAMTEIALESMKKIKEVDNRAHYEDFLKVLHGIKDGAQ